ncbi:hypothetical protein AB0E81_11330 [Streptomyces sp. NPDC033538]|uniref:hypothetical protein n=1 Tax=Streptomyces sp. NPDC033538 TaxID=3155367 RepID=UPI0033E19632
MKRLSYLGSVLALVAIVVAVAATATYVSSGGSGSSTSVEVDVDGPKLKKPTGPKITAPALRIPKKEK